MLLSISKKIVETVACSQWEKCSWCLIEDWCNNLIRKNPIFIWFQMMSYNILYLDSLKPDLPDLEPEILSYTVCVISGLYNMFTSTFILISFISISIKHCISLHQMHYFTCHRCSETCSPNFLNCRPLIMKKGALLLILLSPLRKATSWGKLLLS